MAFTAEAMISPTHRFVGKYSVMGEVEKGFKNGFVGHGGVRFTKYNTINATTGYGLIEKYWGQQSCGLYALRHENNRCRNRADASFSIHALLRRTRQQHRHGGFRSDATRKSRTESRNFAKPNVERERFRRVIG
ncbi:YaiO family outer membrane beta-barrel protein [Biomphalaria pfeifferi]|uniref:YaiO family outer membrane beta-barrel protein n=1 Tax=Biomphalaria pfeifferi TaxID=112525 RepID=A0AAD8AQV2_BIOPF|nr:YaiO family outer membrane beta-barrel protein [Biomphalaria pfeifferi]